MWYWYSPSKSIWKYICSFLSGVWKHLLQKKEIFLTCLQKLLDNVITNPIFFFNFQVPLPFIFGSIAISLFLILTPLIKTPKMEHVYGLIFIISGLLCYWIHVHLNQHSVYFVKVTCYLQLLFNVSPLEDHISTEKRDLKEIFL